MKVLGSSPDNNIGRSDNNLEKSYTGLGRSDDILG